MFRRHRGLESTVQHCGASQFIKIAGISFTLAYGGALQQYMACIWLQLSLQESHLILGGGQSAKRPSSDYQGKRGDADFRGD
jgi:hypothetical protein